ncbi:helix-turn-helix domain-containing protein [Virgibacillus halodenitrificans]|uniref:Transcriptional regulator n=1 Tax=Virgibacillus halodenitrificans TaxID=1482 RepID=A0AAC9NJ19_VIRHA|nr:helix-turn-helix domain-containing protein [Virgibacillus halodenitrificans]APC47182.1 transcriptional regulator [Virgibacillus halodenitrificans]MCG1028001.1 helix-turn-helix domain-containing protein [Virgibacillus halodenitrificans]MEC2159393.1 helix-turn-helix domain-containing protein [Virgibacillus halodenitrificans]
MIELGSYIKLQRTKQEMTQGELAHGIVSLSYLSKIENLKTEASPEIIQALCTRLGIQIDNSLESTIQEKCKEWYGMLFEVNDKEEITSKFKEIQSLMDSNLTESLLLFEIHKIRYYLILGEFDKALNKINELNEISGTFDNLHLYYWYKFRGNYNSANAEYNQAMYLYRLAEEKSARLKIDENEVADLQYVMAITHSKLRNTLEAIDYTNKALNVFMKNYNFLRCAQCHNVLGISYRRIRMYDKAIKNFNLALHLGKLNNNKQLIQLTNQNLGHLYSSKGEAKEAIKHFKEVINDEEVHLVERLASVSSLVREYYNVYNFEETKEAIKYGFELLNQLKNIQQYKIFDYVLNTYSYLMKEEYEKFEELVIKDFIPFLEKHKDFANVIIYAELLARHFEKQYKYKDATKYYKVANFAYEQIANI